MVVEDVDLEFCTLIVENNSLNSKVIKDLEGGVLLDNELFADRFGTLLSVEHLSTGTKAVLLLINTNRIISLIEIGRTHYDYIILNSFDGTVLYYNTDLTIKYELDSNPRISVKYGDFLFTSIIRFNVFLQSEYPFDIDLTHGAGGVEYVHK